MNYELFMGEALAEAQLALSRGERPIAAVAVVDEAMVARAHDRVQETNDPTAHAVIVALREAARKLGSDAARRRHDLRHPRALRDVRRGAARERRRGPRVRAPERPRRRGRDVIQLAQHDALPRRIKVVSGIRRDEAAGALRRRAGRLTRPRTNAPGGRRRRVWYPLPAERCPSG